MSMVQGVVIWGAVAFGAMALAGVLAGIKNRDVSFWMGWSFIVPPMVLILVLLPKNQGPRPRRPSLDDEAEV